MILLLLLNISCFGVEIMWYGHSCFSIKNSSNNILLTDTFDKTVGYEIPKINPDIITVSHQHFDHNAVEFFKNSKVFSSPVDTEFKNFKIKTVESFHDQQSGKQRGENLIFKITTDEINIAHLGDLGHILTEKQIKNLGSIDILFIPVGGFFTIDAKMAEKIVNQLKPKVVIPMHYKTDDLGDLKKYLSDKSQFISFYSKSSLTEVKTRTLIITKDELKKIKTTKIFILTYK